MTIDGIEIRERPTLDDAALNRLFAAAWPGHAERRFARTLEACLTYFGAFRGADLVGFVKVAWDGDQHAFLLDPTVHPDSRRRGLGSALVRAATAAAAASGAAWLHVDFEPALARFYAASGFRPTTAGLIAMSAEP